MAQLSAKISSFPVSDDNPRSTALVVTSGNLLSEDRDPTRELRNLIEQLQDAARDARARQRMAEEERDHAMDELTRSQTDISAARDIEKKSKLYSANATHWPNSTKNTLPSSPNSNRS
jgi:hypothetical protein